LRRGEARYFLIGKGYIPVPASGFGGSSRFQPLADILGRAVGLVGVGSLFDHRFRG
jgi:hypothetical protein